MAKLVVVDDAADPRLHDYVGLTDVQLRRRREPAEGLFIAEGEMVIRRAVEAGYPVRSLLLAPRWLPSLADLTDGLDVPVLLADEALLEPVTGFAVHRGALAAMGRLPLPSVDEVLEGAGQVAVLEDVNSHTNLGAIFRAAAGLGIDAVVLSPRCADPLYRRSVRVSMGAVFRVPYARMQQWPEGFGQVRAAGFALLALTPAPDAVPLFEAAATNSRSALLLGAEGSGVSRQALELADQKVRIPMARGVDSLNVAQAAAIAFYAFACLDPTSC